MEDRVANGKRSEENCTHRSAPSPAHVPSISSISVSNTPLVLSVMYLGRHATTHKHSAISCGCA